MPSWLNTAQHTAPAAATSVSCTPNTTAWTDVTPVQLLAASATSGYATGMVIRTLTTANVGFEVDLCTGAALSETPIATWKGQTNSQAANGANLTLICPIPIAFPASTRLSGRVRTSGGTVVAWLLAATYLLDPLTGDLLTTSSPLLVANHNSSLITVPTGASTWANTAGWTTIVASTSTAQVIANITSYLTSNSLEYEVDLGTGTAGNEVRLCTLKAEGSNGALPWIWNLPNPIDNVGAGVRVASRVRGTRNAYNISVGYGYYAKPL